MFRILLLLLLLIINPFLLYSFVTELIAAVGVVWCMRTVLVQLLVGE